MSTSVYDARGGMRNVWIITASMTVLAICYTMIIPFLPIYLLELGVPKDDVALWSGLVFGITFLIAGIMAPIWGKIADKSFTSTRYSGYIRRMCFKVIIIFFMFIHLILIY